MVLSVFCRDKQLPWRVIGGARGDVGEGPAGFLADALARGAQQRQEAGEGADGEDHLSLHVVARDNVANSAEGGCLHRVGGVEE